MPFGGVFAGFARLWRVLLVEIVLMLAMVLVMFVWAALIGIVTQLVGEVLGVILMLVLLIPVIYLGVAVMPALVVVMETDLEAPGRHGHGLEPDRRAPLAAVCLCSSSVA